MTYEDNATRKAASSCASTAKLLMPQTGTGSMATWIEVLMVKVEELA